MDNQEKLEPKGKLYEKIFKLIPNPAYLLQKLEDDYIIIDFNQAAEELSEGNLRNLLGHKISELIHEKPEILEEFKLNISKGVKFTKEMIIKIPSTGKEKILKVSSENISPDFVICYLEDITERKKIEEEITKFKTISDNANYGIVISEINGNLIYINEYFASIHGYISHKLIGQNLSIFHNDKQLERVMELVKEMLDEGGYSAQEVWHQHKNGTVFPMLMSGVTIKDEKGQPLFMAATAIDITNRKGAEQKLKVSEEKYRELVNNIHESIFELDENGNVEYMSPQIYDISGYRPEEQIGVNLKDLVHPDDLELVIINFKKLMQSGESQSADYRRKHKDGHYVYVNSSGRRLKIGNKYKIIGITKDITERKISDEKLLKSEKKYRKISERYEMLLESISDAVFVLNRDWVYTLMNKLAEKLVNIPVENLLGHKITDIFPGIEQTAFFKTYESVMNTRKPKRVRDSFLHPDGQTGYYEVSVYPISEGILCIGRDVTEEIKAEQKLKESEEKYRVLFENSPVGIGLATLNGKAFAMNKAMENITSYTLEEYDKVNLKETYVDPNQRDLMINLLKEQGVVRDYEIKLKRKDETEYIALMNIDLIELDGEDILLTNVRDITQIKKAEQKLKESEEKYREAYNRSELYKDLFTHDINNILQNILTSTELTKLYSNEPDQVKKFEEVSNLISEQILRGKKLVSNVQKLSEVEEIESPIAFIEASKDLINSVEYVKGSFPHKTININIESFQAQFYVIANDLLINIFENILFNAVKHNVHDIIDILIEISRENKNGTNFIKFQFLDNGVGIPDPMKQEIFSRDYKEIKKDKIPSGIGLGLLLVKKIIDSYDGDIKVKDRIRGDHSKGSNFIILIPEAV